MQIPNLHERLTVSGPYIVLLGCDSAQSIWRASVMIVTPPPQGAVLPAEPTLALTDQGVKEVASPCDHHKQDLQGQGIDRQGAYWCN